MPDNNEQPVDKQTTNEGQGEQPTQEQQGEQPADQNNKTIAYGKTSSGTIKVTIEEEKPRNMTLTLQNIQSIADYGRRSHDKWVINERSGSSLMFRNNGQSSLAASKYAQYKLNPEGASQEQTLISQTITNRKILQTDELIFNNHKFNTHIIDLSDFRKMKVDTNQNCVVGNFTVYGSVLVKAWEENLKRYMLIRRPVRMPLFSPLLNVPDIMPAVGITSPLKRTADLVGISDKGYQVNMIIFDHKTLIGKEGVDRSGINRTPEASGGIINGGKSSSSSSPSSKPNSGKKPKGGSYAGNKVGQEEIFEATAYHPDGSEMEGDFITSKGLSLIDKTIESHYLAVDPDVIEYGTVCILKFPSGWEHLDGEWVAVDCGGAIIGNRLDLMFGSGLIPEVRANALEWGRRDVTLIRTDRILTMEEADHWRE